MAQNPSQQQSMQQSPQGSSSVDTAFLKTPGGILKAVANVAAFLTMIATAVAFNGAVVTYSKLHKQDCDEHVDRGKPAPPFYLTQFALAVVVITWIFLLAMFIVTFLPQVNSKTGFIKADFLGHLISGGCFLFSFVLLIAYVVFVYVNKRCQFDDTRHSSIPTSILTGQSQSNQNNAIKAYLEQQAKEFERTCGTKRSLCYSPIVFAVAGVLALVTGFLAITSPVLGKKGKGPMGAGGQQRPMTPSQGQMQQGGTPSQHANNSVRQFPSMKTGSPSEAVADA